MEYTKEKFIKELQDTRDVKEKGKLTIWGEGYLYALEKVENLILFGVI